MGVTSLSIDAGSCPVDGTTLFFPLQAPLRWLRGTPTLDYQQGVVSIDKVPLLLHDVTSFFYDACTRLFK